jgi:hypothetical protein
MTKFTIVRGEDSETVTMKPKHILRIEREYGESDPVETTYLMAWMASGSDKAFDEWIEDIDEIVPILPEDLEDVEVPPTTAASRRSRSQADSPSGS